MAVLYVPCSLDGGRALPLTDLPQVAALGSWHKSVNFDTNSSTLQTSRCRARREPLEWLQRLSYRKWLKRRPESGRDWRRCAKFARQRRARKAGRRATGPPRWSLMCDTRSKAERTFHKWTSQARGTNTSTLETKRARTLEAAPPRKPSTQSSKLSLRSETILKLTFWVRGTSTLDAAVGRIWHI